ARGYRRPPSQVCGWRTPNRRPSAPCRSGRRRPTTAMASIVRGWASPSVNQRRNGAVRHRGRRERGLVVAYLGYWRLGVRMSFVHGIAVVRAVARLVVALVTRDRKADDRLAGRREHPVELTQWRSLRVTDADTDEDRVG